MFDNLYNTCEESNQPADHYQYDFDFIHGSYNKDIMVQCVNTKLSDKGLQNTSNLLCDSLSTPMQHWVFDEFIYDNVDHCFDSFQLVFSPSLGDLMMIYNVNALAGDMI